MGSKKNKTTKNTTKKTEPIEQRNYLDYLPKPIGLNNKQTEFLKGILEKEVDNNLGQLFTGKELRATFQYKDCYLVNPWEYKDIDVDFSKFIKDVKSHHEAIIAKHKGDDEIKKQFQDIVDVYDVLEKNYNQVLSKTKYA